MSRIRVVERTGSTNADLIAEAAAKEGDWLVTLQQDSGRGRQGREWVSAPGNFYGSTVVMLRPGDPPAQSLALAAGLALIEAVDVAAPDQPLTLKWPNDLMIGDRKLAGILLERSGDRVVLGFGVNLAAAPNLEDRRAASLRGVIAPMAFAPLLAASFDRLLALWRSNDSLSMIHAWQERAHRVGTELAVHLGQDEKLSGRFDGLEPDGALRLRVVGDEVRVIRAADVEVC